MTRKRTKRIKIENIFLTSNKLRMIQMKTMEVIIVKTFIVKKVTMTMKMMFKNRKSLNTLRQAAHHHMRNNNCTRIPITMKPIIMPLITH